MNNNLEPVRNFKFTVTIDDEQIGFMKVSGISISSLPQNIKLVTLTRGFVKNNGYLVKWAKSRALRTVIIEIEDAVRITIEEAFPLVHYFDDLDAGANHLLLESVDLWFKSVNYSPIEVTE